MIGRISLAEVWVIVKDMVENSFPVLSEGRHFGADAEIQHRDVKASSSRSATIKPQAKTASYRPWR
jgi:hypothetical protein